MSTAERAPLLPVEVAQLVRSELLDAVRAAHLPQRSEDALLRALSGPTRVLPEGRPNPCAALTFISYSSAAGEDTLQVVPAIVAIEMLVAAGDLIDDIQDDEAPLPGDRHDMGEMLETVSLLLMLGQLAIARLVDVSVPCARVVRCVQIVGSLGVDALRGQALDMELESRLDVSVDLAAKASRLKSASLTRCAAELGASLGTDDIAEIDLYARFGWHLGLFMQLMNDVKAVWPGASDKSDIRLRKKTLPIAFALSLPPQSSHYANVVRSYYEEARNISISEDEVKWALWRCGAIHYTWIMASREKVRATRIDRVLSAEASCDWAGRLLL